VADNQTLLKKIGLTPGRAALMGLLGAALVGVLYLQFGPSKNGSASPTGAVPPRRPAPPRSAVTPAAQQTASNEESNPTEATAIEFDQSKWKSPELSAVVAYDPFALPAAFPQPQATTAQLTADGGRSALAAANAEQLADELERLQSQLDELKNRGVHVVVSAEGEYVAMIGDRLVHVGDEINEFTVTAIDPNGVRVERKQLP
jgi:hypothetical protein